MSTKTKINEVVTNKLFGCIEPKELGQLLKAIKPFDCYVVLLTQTALQNPDVTDLQNDFDESEFTIERTAPGEYDVTSENGVFTEDKTDIIPAQNFHQDGTFIAKRISDTLVKLTTSVAGVAEDDLLDRTRLEIRVYY